MRDEGGQDHDAPPDEVVQTILHASCVACDRRAVLITGASGQGKSALALRLIALGATLVADDRTIVRMTPEGLVAQAPEAISGLIEARGVGLLHAPVCATARVVLAVNLNHEESERLPGRHNLALLGQSVPLLHKVRQDHFPAAVLHYLRHGRSA